MNLTRSIISAGRYILMNGEHPRPLATSVQMVGGARAVSLVSNFGGDAGN
jgi:hypothetical protein